MRRALPTLALLLAWPAAADAASVRLTGCVPALERAARSATFEARVRAVPGSERMQVRFALQVREPGLAARWRRVAADGFEQWLTSDPGVRRYVYARTIQNLSAPAAYRTVVRFRWLDADGEVVKTARATAAACRQPDLRPDLVPLALEVAPAPQPDQRRYTLTVRNAGRSEAGRFAVAVDGIAPEDVPGLAAGALHTVTFVGPACAAGELVRATVDPGGVVEEREEVDNVLAVSCAP